MMIMIMMVYDRNALITCGQAVVGTCMLGLRSTY